MRAFDPVLNSERIRAGLRLMQTVKEVQQEQSKRHMIVVFAVEPTDLQAGRIHLFQDFVHENTGLLLNAVKWRNACIKVFFDIEGIAPEDLKRLSELFQTASFVRAAKSLGVSHVQLDRIYWPGRADSIS